MNAHMGLSPIWKQQYNILKTFKQKINVLALGYVIFNSQTQVIQQPLHFWLESILFYSSDRCINIQRPDHAVEP